MKDTQGNDAYRTGQLLVRQRRFSDALKVYLDLANAGDPGAQAYVGWMYSVGKGTAIDRDKGLAWYRKAAASGSTMGSFGCGKAALSRQAWTEALAWFHQGADKGHGPSLLWLGLAYLRGYGVPVSLAQGLEYLEKSAATGNFFARREIALLMLRGKLGLLKAPVGLGLLLASLVGVVAQAIRDPNTERVVG